MEVFKNMTEQEIQNAQDCLDKFCNQYDIETWPITAGSGKARWRDLVLAMCGIAPEPPKKRGRKTVANTGVFGR